ncbi:Phage shock protein F [Raoultella terrigena]|uniref:Phage shock protein F n=1 Tax=Raoultella terrigena TaxID=577 RepID=A0A4U9CV50_RAOTE|nr:Phage shock protein F [Raoultella terrigena]
MAEYKDNLLGEANSFLEVLEQVSRLAPLDKPVLVIGERGTGKELIANRLHFLSSRWQGPFISLNCAALNENLLDSELFGHEAGAFTGASKRHPGRFERADGGTLFLDELATAPMLVQEKLLRVIEYGELERVGGSQPLQVNVRLVCATNADLPQMVEAAISAPISSTAWPSTWCSCRRCAKGRATLCCWQTSSPFRCAASWGCRCSPALASGRPQRCWATAGRAISAS